MGTHKEHWREHITGITRRRAPRADTWERPRGHMAMAVRTHRDGRAERRQRD